jgi:hypothetical protein
MARLARGSLEPCAHCGIGGKIESAVRGAMMQHLGAAPTVGGQEERVLAQVPEDRIRLRERARGQRP